MIYKHLTMTGDFLITLIDPLFYSLFSQSNFKSK